MRIHLSFAPAARALLLRRTCAGRAARTGRSAADPACAHAVRGRAGRSAARLPGARSATGASPRRRRCSPRAPNCGVQRCAMDIRNIDVAAASAAGVLVTHASAGFGNSVAEWVLGVMIDLARHISRQRARLPGGHAGADHDGPRAARRDARHHRLRPDRPAPGRAGAGAGHARRWSTIPLQAGRCAHRVGVARRTARAQPTSSSAWRRRCPRPRT